MRQAFNLLAISITLFWISYLIYDNGFKAGIESVSFSTVDKAEMIETIESLSGMFDTIITEPVYMDSKTAIENCVIISIDSNIPPIKLTTSGTTVSHVAIMNNSFRSYTILKRESNIKED